MGGTYQDRMRCWMSRYMWTGGRERRGFASLGILIPWNFEGGLGRRQPEMEIIVHQFTVNVGKYNLLFYLHAITTNIRPPNTRIVICFACCLFGLKELGGKRMTKDILQGLHMGLDIYDMVVSYWTLNQCAPIIWSCADLVSLTC